MVFREQDTHALHHEPMYDPELLKKLDFSQSPTKFNPPVTAVNPGENLLVRPLCRADYEKGFVQLLGQLTSVGDITKEQFLRRYAEMKACKNTYFITVIEDTITNRIIGAATLVIEQKFIHGCAVRGRLEDVVVNDTYRGKQLGKLIVTTVALLAKTLNCYKITLECKDKLIPFYQSIGYVLEPGNSNSMSIRFDAPQKKHTPNAAAKL
ncbi:probable glucosamine 6-phosphate N-acetyltransferase isoform X1 [Schistocerca americana]|uniref:probable glucosamine 6-phosphate N-acetyltransferase isoform X1 n=1 Tax=Schistocerca americana TaxID=7009 RepID=UPI001F4FD61F|nr:probable glucosamine 6-phosphate N-acetyltransferase isoform X1 [Schistocerca americana]XP_047113997.1 probable glucosamine 6-phosphate N-acetyltransferase isoform X1 [Schistocerca piceifrons]XP_049858251.1 probable glucosamine 6-phosphate N-acetyltransferase isoform X1 [Schistocerca gregaria]XP_049955392.1 probable glucosamine 6-phosphate N-acetyltransferase isoform X1 [Schistocerca serialis cubense]